MKQKKLKILLVESNPTTTILWQALLSQIPQIEEVVYVSHNIAALNLIHQKVDEFCLIITTAYDDGLNGFDFIKNLSKFRINIPVVMTSTDSTIKRKALKNGAIEFLEKPIDFKKLKSIIEQVADLTL